MNTNMKVLNLNELEQVNGGNILFDKVDIRDVIELNPIGAIKKWINIYEKRTHNKYAIYKAAVKSGIEEKNVDPW